MPATLPSSAPSPESASAKAAHAPHRSAVLDTPVGAALVWLRRDLRLDDHAALHHALRSARKVWCAFIFDTTILDPLPRADRRV